MDSAGTRNKRLKHTGIQCLFFLIQNPLLANFFNGRIYQGKLKMICTPGLNCYSCPAAITACPIGAMQNFLSGAKHSISLFVTGFLLSVGVAFGRLICGYLCPMGFLQDLLYKIKTPKIRVKLRFARYIKYAVLLLFVFILPFVIRHDLSGLGETWFCKYICPSGTIFGAIPLLSASEVLRGFIGIQFVIKASVASALVFANTFVYRLFCRTLCPLGAVYSLLNPIALIKLNHDDSACTNCGKCAKACNLCLDPAKQPNAPECVRCGSCKSACGSHALNYGMSKKGVLHEKEVH